jgi:hypothetical protein
VQLVQTSLSDKYPNEAACVDSGEAMKYISKRDANELKIGFVRIKNGTIGEEN